MSIKKHSTPKGIVTYRVRVDVPPDALTGKRRQRMKTVRTKKEAESLERQWLTEIERGTVVDATKMYMRDLAAQWLQMREKRGNIEVTTLAQYRYSVTKYILPTLGNVPVQRLTVNHVQDLYDALATHPWTAKKAHQILKQMLDYARRQQWMARNFTDDADAPSAKENERATWTADEIRRFLDVAESDAYSPLWLIGVTTGMRRGELLGLRWRDVDFTKGVLHVRQAVVAHQGSAYIKDVKTPASRRTIKLPADTLAALREHRKHQNEMRLAAGPKWRDLDLVIATRTGGPLYPSNVWKKFTRLVKEAAVSTICIHGLRHTHATLLLKEGVNVKVVSERLGHAHIGITLGIYAHVLPDMQEQAVSAIDALIRTDNGRLVKQL